MMAGHSPVSYDLQTNLTSVTNYSWTEDDVTSSTMTPPVKRQSAQWLGDMRFVSDLILCLPISVLGVVGNVLSFIVLCRHKHRLSTTVLLQALAMVDTIILISTVLLSSLRYVGWSAYQDKYHYIFIVLYPTLYLVRLLGTYLTVLLTCDRFIAVCYPLHAQRLCVLPRTYLNIGVLFVFSFFFSLVRYFEYQIVPKEVNPFQFQTTSLFDSKFYVMFYRIVMFFVVMYLVPTTLMIVLNSRLLRTLQQATSCRASMQARSEARSGAHSSERVKHSITMIVTVVVSVAIACNLAAMISHVLYSLESSSASLKYLEMYRRVASTISNLLVTLNSAINFIVYCVCSRNFRKVFASTFGCKNSGCVAKSPTACDIKRRSAAGSSTYMSALRSSTSRSPDKTNII